MKKTVLLLGAVLIAGCGTIHPVVTLEGPSGRGNFEYIKTAPNTDALPCTGHTTDVVVGNNVGWGGWRDAVLNIAGNGLARHGCVWVRQAQAAFSLLVSFFQPGDSVVGSLELVENATSAVQASIHSKLDHNYGGYAQSCYSAGCVYITPRDQAVFNALDIALNGALDHLGDIGSRAERLGRQP